MGLPAVVGECLVGFGHLVDVFLALEGRALARGGVEDLIGEAFRHVLVAALAGEVHDPANRQRVRTAGAGPDPGPGTPNRRPGGTAPRPRGERCRPPSSRP